MSHITTVTNIVGYTNYQTTSMYIETRLTFGFAWERTVDSQVKVRTLFDPSNCAHPLQFLGLYRPTMVVAKSIVMLIGT